MKRDAYIPVAYIECSSNINPCLHAFVSWNFISYAITIQIMAQIPIRPCAKCCIQSSIRWCVSTTLRRCKDQIPFHNMLTQPSNEFIVNALKWFLLIDERLFDARLAHTICTECGKMWWPHIMIENRFDQSAVCIQ